MFNMISGNKNMKLRKKLWQVPQDVHIVNK